MPGPYVYRLFVVSASKVSAQVILWYSRHQGPKLAQHTIFQKLVCLLIEEPPQKLFMLGGTCSYIFDG